MKNLIKTTAFCAAIVFAISFSALAKDNSQNRTARTEISHVKILKNASSAKCLVEMGKLCDQAQATATSTSQSAQTTLAQAIVQEHWIMQIEQLEQH